jgi:hypothetical protein
VPEGQKGSGRSFARQVPANRNRFRGLASANARAAKSRDSDAPSSSIWPRSWINMPFFPRSVRLRRTRFHLWPLRYQWHPAGANRRQSPFGPARGAGPSGSGPAAFYTNCLWIWGPLHTAPAVNRHRFLTLMPDASLPIKREARTRAARDVGGLPRGAQRSPGRPSAFIHTRRSPATGNLAVPLCAEYRAMHFRT